MVYKTVRAIFIRRIMLYFGFIPKKDIEYVSACFQEALYPERGPVSVMYQLNMEPRRRDIFRLIIIPESLDFPEKHIDFYPGK